MLEGLRERADLAPGLIALIAQGQQGFSPKLAVLSHGYRIRGGQDLLAVRLIEQSGISQALGTLNDASLAGQIGGGYLHDPKSQQFDQHAHAWITVAALALPFGTENVVQVLRRHVIEHEAHLNNRAGGFRHIEDWLQKDPDPASAWSWFFEQMMRWENKYPALLFGQSFLRQLLNDGDDGAAVKVMMRCRLEDPDFLPLADDLGAAIEAAERRRNHELAAFLRSRV